MSIRKRAEKSLAALLRIESKRLELAAPFRGSIAKSLDTDAAGQAAFDRRANKIRREECVERQSNCSLF
jgi:hypothetical protein